MCVCVAMLGRVSQVPDVLFVSLHLFSQCSSDDTLYRHVFQLTGYCLPLALFDCVFTYVSCDICTQVQWHAESRRGLQSPGTGATGGCRLGAEVGPPEEQ